MSESARDPAGGRPPDEAPARAHSWQLAIVALIFGMFMVILDTSIVNIAIPTLETAFGVGTSSVEWVVTVYLLALGVTSPASGWLADRLGYKRLYLLGMGVFTGGSLLAAAAPTLSLLIAARVVQAIGGGMVPAATTALIFRIVPREKLGVANGFRGIALLLGPALGPTLGGYLVQYVDWRWIFTINVPIGIVGIALGLAVIPEVVSRTGSRFDAWGFTTAAVGLGSLLLALSEGQADGWGSAFIVMLFYVAGVALIAFVWVELRAPDPMIDLRVLRLHSFAGGVVYTVLLSLSMTAGLFFIPIFLQLVRGEGALQVGLVLLPGAAATAVMMPIAGRLYDLIDAKPLVLVGTCVLAYANWLFHGLTLATPNTTIAAWSALRGAGMGLAMMPALTAGMSVVPTFGVSRAAAMRTVIQRASGSFGIAALTVLLDRGIASNAAAIASRVTSTTPAGARIAGLLRHPAALPGGVAALHARIEQVAFARSIDHIFGILSIAALAAVVPALFLRGDHGPAAPAGLRARGDEAEAEASPAGRAPAAM